jgi:hypothetical protein
MFSVSEDYSTFVPRFADAAGPGPAEDDRDSLEFCAIVVMRRPELDRDGAIEDEWPLFC